MLLEPGIDPPQGPTWRRRSERRRAARHHREWETQSLPRPGRLRLPSAIDSTTPLIQNQTRLQKKAERPRQTKTQLVFSSRNGRQSPSPLAFSLSRDSPRSLPSGSIRESELREGEVIAPPRPARALPLRPFPPRRPISRIGPWFVPSIPRFPLCRFGPLAWISARSVQGDLARRGVRDLPLLLFCFPAVSSSC
jgi:hypothetical protein